MANHNTIEFTKRAPNDRYYGVENEINVSEMAQAVIDALALAISVSADLVPNPDGTDQMITVTAVSAAWGGSLHANTEFVRIRFEGASVRVTFNGNTAVAGNPPTGLGELMTSGDRGFWNIDTLTAARFINNTGSTGYFTISEWMRAT